MQITTTTTIIYEITMHKNESKGYKSNKMMMQIIMRNRNNRKSKSKLFSKRPRFIKSILSVYVLSLIYMYIIIQVLLDLQQVLHHCKYKYNNGMNKCDNHNNLILDITTKMSIVIPKLPSVSVFVSASSTSSSSSSSSLAGSQRLIQVYEHEYFDTQRQIWIGGSGGLGPFKSQRWTSSPFTNILNYDNYNYDYQHEHDTDYDTDSHHHDKDNQNLNIIDYNSQQNRISEYDLISADDHYNPHIYTNTDSHIIPYTSKMNIHTNNNDNDYNNINKYQSKALPPPPKIIPPRGYSYSSDWKIDVTGKIRDSFGWEYFIENVSSQPVVLARRRRRRWLRSVYQSTLQPYHHYSSQYQSHSHHHSPQQQQQQQYPSDDSNNNISPNTSLNSFFKNLYSSNKNGKLKTTTKLTESTSSSSPSSSSFLTATSSNTPTATPKSFAKPISSTQYLQIPKHSIYIPPLSIIIKNIQEQILDSFNFKGYGISVYKSFISKYACGMTLRIPITANFNFFERRTYLPLISTSIGIYYPLRTGVSLSCSMPLAFLQALSSLIMDYCTWMISFLYTIVIGTCFTDILGKLIVFNIARFLWTFLICIPIQIVQRIVMILSFQHFFSTNHKNTKTTEHVKGLSNQQQQQTQEQQQQGGDDDGMESNVISQSSKIYNTGKKELISMTTTHFSLLNRQYLKPPKLIINPTYNRNISNRLGLSFACYISESSGFYCRFSFWHMVLPTVDYIHSYLLLHETYFREMIRECLRKFRLSENDLGSSLSNVIDSALVDDITSNSNINAESIASNSATSPSSLSSGATKSISTTASVNAYSNQQQPNDSKLISWLRRKTGSIGISWGGFTPEFPYYSLSTAFSLSGCYYRGDFIKKLFLSGNDSKGNSGNNGMSSSSDNLRVKNNMISTSTSKWKGKLHDIDSRNKFSNQDPGKHSQDYDMIKGAINNSTTITSENSNNGSGSKGKVPRTI